MSNILKGLNEGYFNRDEQDQQNAMDTRRRSDLSGERNAGLNEPDELPTTPQQSRNGVYEYNVPAGQEKIAQELGLQLHKGHWFSRVPVQRANFQFGRPQFHEIPSKNVSEAEQDYGPEYQDKVKRLGQMAKQGERKTVYDPVKRVYKTVPVNPPKEQGVTEGSLNEDKGFDVVKSLVSAFNNSVSGNVNIPLAAERPGSRVFTRSDGTRYRDHGNIRFYQGWIDPQDVDKWKATKPVEKFWDWLKSQPGVKPIGQVSGEFRQDPMRDAVAYKGQYFVLTPHGSVIWGSVSRFKNPRSVWRQQNPKQGMAEGVAETLPIDDAVKVLRQYGADHFKTTSNELHFYKQGRPFSVDLVMNPDATRSVTLSSLNSATRGLKGQGVAEEQLDELKCWSGYTRVQGVPAGAPGSCKKKTNEEDVAEATGDVKFDKMLKGITGKKEVAKQQKIDTKQQARDAFGGMFGGGNPADKLSIRKKGVAEDQEEKCPHCGGAMFSEMIMNEKKDACYYKVKSRYKVWPSAYASGALVKCRKSGADSWGDGGKKNESSILEGIEQVDENLNKWFKEKWVRFGPDGKIRGDCARGDDSEGKPKCLPQSKAQNLGKEGRASAAARKRREDPNPERSGKAINVNTKKK